MKPVVLFAAILLFTSIAIGQNRNRFEEEGDDKETPKTEQNQPAEEDAKKQNTTSSSTRSRSNFWSRTRFGGNLGAGFSNGFSYVNVSPRMYYLATEKLWLGAGLTFIWSKYNYYPAPYDEQFVYGANVSAQYMLFGPIFLHAEYEPLSYERPQIQEINGTRYIVGEDRVWIHGLLLGGGVSQRIGNGMLFISVLYNVTWSDQIDSYYSSPWVFRIGFGI